MLWTLFAACDPPIRESGDTGDSGDTGASGPVYDGEEGPYEVDALADQADGNTVIYYLPAGEGPWPVVIWSHGFSRGPENHSSAARRLATWGFLVATPQLPSLSDHAENGSAIADIFLPAVRSTFSSSVSERAAFVGHSAGGLASIIAAAQSEVDAVVALDGTDVDDLGLVAAPGVDEPTLLLVGDASVCNSQGNGREWADELGGVSWLVGVTDASHCDFESDTNSVCEAACGDVDDDRQRVVQAYADAWVIHHLASGADEWVGGSQAEADRDAGAIVY